MKYRGKYWVFLVFMLCCLSSVGKAQKLVFFFGHAQYAAPLDKNFRNNYNFGVGAEAGMGVGLKKTFLIATTGYNHFNANKGHIGGDLSYIPIKAGLRQYILPGKILFLNADAGIAFVKSKSMSSSESRFTADAGLGVKLFAFEIMATYDGFTRKSPETPGFSSWFGIKAGWRFGL